MSIKHFSNKERLLQLICTILVFFTLYYNMNLYYKKPKFIIILREKIYILF